MSNEVPDSPAVGYEQARAELTDVVRRLEAGGTTLEEALALWERGEALAAICQEWLDGARRRLTQARARDGQDVDQPSDAEAGDARRES